MLQKKLNLLKVLGVDIYIVDGKHYILPYWDSLKEFLTYESASHFQENEDITDDEILKNLNEVDKSKFIDAAYEVEDAVTITRGDDLIFEYDGKKYYILDESERETAINSYIRECMLEKIRIATYNKENEWLLVYTELLINAELQKKEEYEDCHIFQSDGEMGNSDFYIYQIKY